MINFAEFVHFLAFSIGIVTMAVVMYYRRRAGFSALSAYMRFILFANLVIILSHFLNSIIRTLWTHEQQELILCKSYPFLVTLFGGIRLLAAMAIIGFSFGIIEKKVPVYFRYATGLFFIIVSFILIRSTAGTGDGYMVSKGAILSFHLYVLLSIIFGYILFRRNRTRIRIFHVEKLELIYLFCLFYGFLEVVFRIIFLFGDEKLEAYIILGIGSILLAFNILNVVYFRSALKLPHLTVALSSEQLIKKYGITSREEEIIELICKGKTNKEIGEILFISPVTVRDHTSNIYKKTGVRSRTELAGLFIERPTG